MTQGTGINPDFPRQIEIYGLLIRQYYKLTVAALFFFFLITEAVT